MSPESIKQVLDALERHGASAIDGIASNAVMVAWGNVLTLIVLMCISALSVYVCWRLWRKYIDLQGYEGDGLLLLSMVSSFVAAGFIIAFFVGLFELPGDIAAIRNPRAAAIRILLQR